MIGVDEVGRGCLAGPLLVVAVRHVGTLPDGLADSKLLTREQREALYGGIKNSCSLGEGWVQPEEIDERGMAAAMRLGVSRALLQLGAAEDAEVIMDGNVNYCPPEFVNTRVVIKADAAFPIVSAASIYAKVTRDRYMQETSEKFPKYQFEKHVGYGTKLHRDMLKKYGHCELHRLSFKPLQELIKNV